MKLRIFFSGLLITLCITTNLSAMDFTGVYNIKTQKNHITLSIKQNADNKITGLLSSTTGENFDIKGNADEDVAIGECSKGATKVSFEAHFEDSFLYFTLIGASQNDSKVIKFSRGKKSKSSANGVFNMLSTNSKHASKISHKKTGKSSKNLLGNWICRTQQGNLTLNFISTNQLTFNGSQASYERKNNSLVVVADGETLNYPYAFQNNGLIITFPNGAKAFFTRNKQASSKANTQASNHFRQLIGKWKDIRSSGNTIIELFSNGQYSYYSDYSAGNSSSGQTNWGYGNSNTDRGTWKAQGTARQGTIYYQSQDGSRDTLSYHVHVEKGQTYWSEYIFDGKIYVKQ